MDTYTLFTVLHRVNRYGTDEYRVHYLPPNYSSPCRLMGVYRGNGGEALAHETLFTRFPKASQLSEKEFNLETLKRQRAAKETESIIVCIEITPAEFTKLRTALVCQSGIELNDEELRRAARQLAQLSLRTLCDEAEQSHEQQDQHQITVTLDTQMFERFRTASAQHHGIASENFNNFLVHWSGQKALSELINAYCDEAEQRQQGE